jgi:hypothetical protein
MQDNFSRSSAAKDKALKNANSHFSGAGRDADPARTEAARAQAATDANTLRLRALRLARDQADKDT